MFSEKFWNWRKACPAHVIDVTMENNGTHGRVEIRDQDDVIASGVIFKIGEMDAQIAAIECAVMLCPQEDEA